MTWSRKIATVVCLAAAAGTARADCVGDCSGDRLVSAQELVRAVNVALGMAPPRECYAGDSNRDGRVTIDELLLAVQNVLDGCGGGLRGDLEIPDDFDYATSRDVVVELAVCTPNGNPFPGVPVTILAPGAVSGSPAEVLWRGATNARGRYFAQIQIPARFAAVRVVVSAAGIVNDVVVPVIDARVVHDFACDRPAGGGGGLL